MFISPVFKTISIILQLRLVTTILLLTLCSLLFSAATQAAAPYEEGDSGSSQPIEEVITEWVEEEGTTEQQKQWDGILDGSISLPNSINYASPGGVIWRGFHHSWEYNHRLNRLADMVSTDGNCNTSTTNLNVDENANCSATVTHGAASGSGSDTASFKSFHTFVGSNDIYFKEGARTFALEGTEGVTMLPTPITVNIPISDFSDAGNNLNYEVILAGFDVVATKKAKKLEHLKIAVGDVTQSANDISFDISVELQVDCDSLECGILGLFFNNANYDIEVNYVVIAAKTSLFSSSSSDFQYPTYNWSAPSPLCLSNCTGELQLIDQTYPETITGTGNNQFSTAALGFKALEVWLDKEHHMVEFDTSIQPGSYNSITGEYSFDLELMFKAWNENVAAIINLESGSGLDELSFTSSGAATFATRIALLEFNNSCTTEAKENGTIYWDASNDSAESNDALKSLTAEFWYDGNNCGETLNLPTEEDCYLLAQNLYNKCMNNGGTHLACQALKESIESQCSENFNTLNSGQIYLEQPMIDIGPSDAIILDR